MIHKQLLLGCKLQGQCSFHAVLRWRVSAHKALVYANLKNKLGHTSSTALCILNCPPLLVWLTVACHNHFALDCTCVDIILGEFRGLCVNPNPLVASLHHLHLHNLMNSNDESASLAHKVQWWKRKREQKNEAHQTYTRMPTWEAAMIDIEKI